MTGTKSAKVGGGYGNSLSLDNLLNNLIQASSGTERDKGTRFETLIRDWLTKEPTYRDLFTEVLTYKDWSGQHPELVSSRPNAQYYPNSRNIAPGFFHSEENLS